MRRRYNEQNPQSCDECGEIAPLNESSVCVQCEGDLQLQASQEDAEERRYDCY